MSVYSSSNSSFYDWQNFPACLSLFTTYFVCSILLLPLFVLVLYTGCLRWRKQRSVAKAAVTSHSDIFTFNMIAMELISLLGSSFYCYGIYCNHSTVTTIGIYLWSTVSPAQTLFHVLTCVERYLAVVHPITYMGLRRAGGVRIRNISIGCVWLICFGSPNVLNYFAMGFILNLIFLLFSAIVVSFCSLSVLCVLIRPGPGTREQVNQSKHRAFHTLTVIMGALLLRFLSILVYTVLNVSLEISLISKCVIIWSLVWCSIPSSSVLPLLFLHRAGKLPACKQSSVSA